MKKIFALLLATVMCLALAGCGSSGGSQPAAPAASQGDSAEESQAPAVDTENERLAAKYLSLFNNLKNPHSMELYSAWIYIDENKDNPEKDRYYFTFIFSAENDLGGKKEYTYGNEEYVSVGGYHVEGFGPVTNIDEAIVEASKQFNIGVFKGWSASGTKAKKNGVKLDAKIVQEFYMDMI